MNVILQAGRLYDRVHEISALAAPILLILLSSFPAVAQKSLVPEPAVPAARTFHDSKSGVSFQVPSGWNLSLKDREVSTFRMDAPSAIRTTQMRALASIGFNPYPESTFSGAFFYLSLTPHLAAVECERQATVSGQRTASMVPIGSLPFKHGYEEHGGVCTESRDEIYTATRNGSCYRFDLLINNFCGGDVSGVRDITAAQIEAVRRRLEAILATVRFDP